MLNIIDVTVEFEFGILDDREMSVEIISNDRTITASSINNIVTVKEMRLPNQIKIKFSGKSSRDTRINSEGDIIQDMYVKIVGLKLDNLKVPDWVIQKKSSYTTEHGKVIETAYVGFNGTMIIDIPESNIFAFYRRLTNDN
jgi:hypothetical protein